MDLIFFFLSKLIWLVVSPDILLVILILTGVTLLLAGAVGKAKCLLSLAALAILVTIFLPLGNLLIAPLDNRFPSPPPLPARVDGIICLGGAENPFLSHARGQVEMGGSVERLLAFVKLMRAYPEAVPIFSGGSGSLSHQAYKDADVARMALEDLGLDVSSIVFESRSRNTYENGKITREVARPRPGQTWILVTSAAHMPRSVGVFRKLGWEVLPYPVDHLTPPDGVLTMTMNFTGNLSRLRVALREWMGLTAYYVTGKTSQWLPGPDVKDSAW